MISSQQKRDKSKEDLSSLWHLLHSMSAYYPEKPTDDEKETHSEVLKQFGNIAEHSSDFENWGGRFSKYLDAYPPNLSDRKSFSIWMCEHHNRMRVEEGKEEFSCDYENLKKRWGPV